MRKPSKNQIQEWTENPVTLYFKQIVDEERRFFQEGRSVDSYHAFEPHKTQEVLANLNGSVDSLSWVIRLVEGDLGEDDEFRDIPER